jgi:hypothetical protein
MGETLTWASTPEAKAKLAAGHRPPERKKWDCPDMKRAREQAEKAKRDIDRERAAVGGEATNNTGEEK